MTTLAPASASILTVPSPRPEAPPVTMNVLPLSCMDSPLSLLRALLLLRHQPRAVAQQRIQAVLRAGEFPVGRFGVAGDHPARLSVLRRRDRLHAVGSNEILDEPLIGLGLDFGQRLPDGEQRPGLAAHGEVAARRLGLAARKRSDRRALHDFLPEKEAPERAALPC